MNHGVAGSCVDITHVIVAQIHCNSSVPAAAAAAAKERQGNEEFLYSAIYSTHTLKALRRGSHSFTCKLYNADCLSFVSVHQMALPLTEVAGIQLQLTTHLSTQRCERLSLAGWPIADGLSTEVVTRQLQVECRTGKVCRSKTDILPLCHATN